ncbi:Retrovirus-related Pol polyprotein from transposon 297 [Araneus ventricosus]|uniref:Retrovirus-related Pol polyprotein from transposon 297 n=1 Tax=Araneus ventricosus TaxID=182803 RepID=A0A4Y2C6C4_ARAVE|nr:Retrovirus-related Pol polyprotein from transposon 297 [Araneus ventricosus]
MGNEERVIAYFSKSLGKPERNYCVTRKELLAIVKSIEHLHHYLYARKFLLRTDHASLRWLLNFKEPEGQIARWIQRLQEYDFEIQHRKGTCHGNADALSRRPCKENCKQCTNAEKKYGMERDISVKVLTTTTVDPWSSVADWLGCQLARWQVGPLNRRQFGPPRKCGREAKKNSFSQTHKQNSPFPQGPCFGVRHPFLGIYCRRNSTIQTAGGRISARRNQGPGRNGVLSTSFELPIIYRCFTSKPSRH